MKKLIALLTALLVSMFNNVEFTTVEDRVYTTDNYYKVDEADPPDYRDLYNYSMTASKTDNCRTANWMSRSAKEVDYTGVTGEPTVGYWIENNKTVKASEVEATHTLGKKTYTFTNASYIVAPYDCQLLTSSSTSDGHSMSVKVVLGTDTYRLDIIDMERWYCCNAREPQLKQDQTVLEYPWAHTSAEQKGKTFQQGNVLGLAVENKTKVTIVKLSPTGGELDAVFADMYLQR